MKAEALPPKIYRLSPVYKARQHHGTGEQVAERGRDSHAEDADIPQGYKQEIQENIGNDHNADAEVTAPDVVVVWKKYHEHPCEYLPDYARRITHDIIRHQRSQMRISSEQRRQGIPEDQADRGHCEAHGAEKQDAG